MKPSSSKDLIPTKKWSGIYFIPCSSNLGCIAQTKRQLKIELDEHCSDIKNEELYSSFIASHSWSHNHYSDFTKVSIVSSHISASHLNFY